MCVHVHVLGVCACACVRCVCVCVHVFCVLSKRSARAVGGLVSCYVVFVVR